MAGLISDFISAMETVISGMSIDEGYLADWKLCASPDPAIATALLADGYRCAYLEVNEEAAENESLWRAEYQTMSVYENTLSVTVHALARQTYPDDTGAVIYGYNDVVSEVIEDVKKGFGTLVVTGAQYVMYSGFVSTPHNDVTQPAKIDVSFKIRYYQHRNEPETIVT